jgi:uncharacterized protein HemX
MSQDLETRLVSLEQSAHRWKAIALVSWGLLAVVLAIAFSTSYALEVRAMQAREQSTELERQAQEEAQRARDEAEQARQNERRARERAEKARQQSMLEMYQRQILLADQAWQKADLRPSGKP